MSNKNWWGGIRLPHQNPLITLMFAKDLSMVLAILGTLPFLGWWDRWDKTNYNKFVK
jgi:hypothetical protein